MPNRSILDPTVIETLRQLSVPGEPDVLTEVLTLFLEEAPPRIEKLRNAWAAGDIKEVQRVAHSLKGSAGNIGATALFEVCKKIDAIGRPGGSGGTEDIGPLVDALAVEFAKVEREIHQLIDA
jgi:HPt (histidine-containing phosphotransfer) domain-containing protein